jgi:outer membrane protein assembly factor BamB
VDTGETGTHSAVAVAGRSVFVGGASSTYALDASNGDTEWRAPVGGTTPAVAADVVFVGGAAFSATTGQQVWDPRLTASAPVVADGTIYLATKKILYAFGR